jgi:hypothetical protein
MKTAAAMGLVLALLGGAAWGATVDAAATPPTAEAHLAAAPETSGLMPGSELTGEAADPFQAKEPAPTDGPLAILGISKSSPLPDPASWAMMIVGFFGAGYLLRSGRSGGLRILRENKARRAVGKGDTAAG